MPRGVPAGRVIERGMLRHTSFLISAKLPRFEQILPVGHRLMREVAYMDQYFITFRSVTYAQKGEAILKRAGMDCSLQRTPKWMEERGCGYCIRLHKKDLQSAVALLREKGGAFRKVYVQRDGGTPEELRL